MDTWYATKDIMLYIDNLTPLSTLLEGVETKKA